jgi:hypothetical protein
MVFQVQRRKGLGLPMNTVVIHVVLLVRVSILLVLVLWGGGNGSPRKTVSAICR